MSQCMAEFTLTFPLSGAQLPTGIVPMSQPLLEASLLPLSPVYSSSFKDQSMSPALPHQKPQHLPRLQ